MQKMPIPAYTHPLHGIPQIALYSPMPNLFGTTFLPTPKTIAPKPVKPAFTVGKPAVGKPSTPITVSGAPANNPVSKPTQNASQTAAAAAAVNQQQAVRNVDTVQKNREPLQTITNTVSQKQAENHFVKDTPVKHNHGLGVLDVNALSPRPAKKIIDLTAYVLIVNLFSIANMMCLPQKEKHLIKSNYHLE